MLVEYFDIVRKLYNSEFKRRRELSRAVRAYKMDDNNYKDIHRKVFNELPATFVLSTGRCGTLFLTDLLEKHYSNIDVYHKPNPEFSNFNNEIYHNFEDVDTYAKIFEYSRFDRLKEAYILHRKYVETSCKTTFLAYSIDRLFRNVRFVHLVRDPNEFVASTLARGYYHSHFADQSRIFPAADELNWEDMSLIDKNYWNWYATNKFIEDFKVQTSSAVLTIRSDRFFRDERLAKECLKFISHGDIPRNQINIENKRKKNVGKYYKEKVKMELDNTDLENRVSQLIELYA